LHPLHLTKHCVHFCLYLRHAILLLTHSSPLLTVCVLVCVFVPLHTRSGPV
jgi:hypothetical protein